MDGWSLLDEVDLTVHVGSDFFDAVKSAKWTERRDALQALCDTLARNPRLHPNIKYTDILAQLKLVVAKDSNVVVVTQALRALAAFINGLRKNFAKYVPVVLVAILEKFKEKKVTVKEAIVECLTLVALHCDSSVLISPICHILEKNTNPNVKANVDQWIYSILCHYSRNDAPLAFIKAIAPYLVKHSSDSDPDVREGSYMAFGAVLRLTEEKAAVAIADGVFCDKGKSKKIEEYSVKAFKDYEALEKARIEAGFSMNGLCASEENKENDIVSNGADGFKNDALVDPWDLLCETKICDKLPHDLQTVLASKQWKERKEILEALLDILEKNPRLCPQEDHSKLIGTLCKILEKDVNINVAALAAKCIKGLAKGLRYKFASCIPDVYASAFEKFRERKAVLREPLIELCDTLALLVPLSGYIEAVEVALQRPNPQIKTQTALFIARLLRQHNAETIPLVCVRQKLGPALSKLGFDADSDVRDASFVAFGAIMRIVGENGINIYCGDIVQDEGKLAKVRENCENMKKEFGLDASAPILRLHNRTKTAEMKAKAVDNSTLGVPSRVKCFKNGAGIMKKVKKSAMDSKSKAYSAPQRRQMVPSATSHLARSSSSAITLRPKASQTMHVKSGTDVGDGEHKSNGRNGAGRPSSTENDEFFDAAEEMEMARQEVSDPDSSSGSKNRTYTLEKGPENAVIEEEVAKPHTECDEQRPISASSVASSVASSGSRMPSRIPRSMSKSRIPLLVSRRT